MGRTALGRLTVRGNVDFCSPEDVSILGRMDQGFTDIAIGMSASSLVFPVLISGLNMLVYRATMEILLLYAPLGIKSYRDRPTFPLFLCLPGIVYDRLMVFITSVGEVHSHNVKPSYSDQL